MLELIIKNKEWVFSGIGVTMLTFGLGILVNFIRRKIVKKQPPQINQTSSDNTVTIQGARDISVGTITVHDHKIPAALAKPNFSIKQVGFCGSVGAAPEYTLLISNNGGACFNASLRHDESSETYSFPRFSRGASKRISMSFQSGAGSVLVIINGLDENGNEYKQLIQGTRYMHGFEFS